MSQITIACRWLVTRGLLISHMQTFWWQTSLSGCCCNDTWETWMSLGIITSTHAVKFNQNCDITFTMSTFNWQWVHNTYFFYVTKLLVVGYVPSSLFSLAVPVYVSSLVSSNTNLTVPVRAWSLVSSLSSFVSSSSVLSESAVILDYVRVKCVLHKYDDNINVLIEFTVIGQTSLMLHEVDNLTSKTSCPH